MRLTSKGQVTIPQNIRAQAGLSSGSEVEFQFVDGHVRLEKVESSPGVRRRRIAATLDDVVGCATANRKLSTDDVMRMTRGGV